MAQRLCRYCYKPILPLKDYYWWCSVACRDASVHRGGGSTYDQGYRDGFSAGYRCGLTASQQSVRIPPELWRPLITLTYLVHWEGIGLACAANTCVRWLLY